MIPILSRAQIRALDAYAIDTAKVPGVVLMENAGRGAADAIEREILGGAARGKSVVVVCGAGNNGGDGFVVARHLVVRGARAHVFLAGAFDKLGGDARVNADAWRGIGGHVIELGDDLQPIEEAIAFADVVIDALFGTGLDRALSPEHVAIVSAMNRAAGRVAALDIPSGLDAENGRVHGAAVRAALTVTFAQHKLGMMTPSGAAHAGRVVVADIGVPAELVGHVGRSAELLEERDVATWLSPRAVDAHKNSAGHVAAIAGSPGKIGAALMVAHAAMRAGAGLATIVTWSEAASAVDARLLEVMSASVDRKGIVASIDRALAGKRAAVIGPGFGTDDDARAAVTHVLASFEGPLVVDADALSLFTGKPESLARPHATILTPHPGEAGRLLGKSSAEIEADRFAAVRELAARAAAVVVLKGAFTLVASPDGRITVNPSGNPALATAGAGDTLGGILGAFACALDARDAACAAVYVHGAAADRWSAMHGDRGLLASEVADRVPDVVAACVRGHTRCTG